MPADNIACALRTGRSQMNVAIGQLDQPEVAHAREHSADRLFAQKWQLTGWTFNAQCACLCRLPFFAANPDLL